MKKASFSHILSIEIRQILKPISRTVAVAHSVSITLLIELNIILVNYLSFPNYLKIPKEKDVEHDSDHKSLCMIGYIMFVCVWILVRTELKKKEKKRGIFIAFFVLNLVLTTF